MGKEVDAGAHGHHKSVGKVVGGWEEEKPALASRLVQRSSHLPTKIATINFRTPPNDNAKRTRSRPPSIPQLDQTRKPPSPSSDYHLIANWVLRKLPPTLPRSPYLRPHGLFQLVIQKTQHPPSFDRRCHIEFFRASSFEQVEEAPVPRHQVPKITSDTKAGFRRPVRLCLSTVHESRLRVGKDSARNTRFEPCDHETFMQRVLQQYATSKVGSKIDGFGILGVWKVLALEVPRVLGERV